MVKVAKELQDIPFVFAGAGPLEGKLAGVPNITNLGFLSGEELIQHIQEAKFTVCPSEWYEPFGLTVTESITNGTPVLGANIGGIPEIIEDKITGQLFEAGNVQDLKDQIWKLYCDDNTVATYSHNCTNANFISIQAYVDRLIQIYQL